MKTETLCCQKAAKDEAEPVTHSLSAQSSLSLDLSTPCAGYVPDSIKAVDAEILRRQKAAKGEAEPVAPSTPAREDGPAPAMAPTQSGNIFSRVSALLR